MQTELSCGQSCPRCRSDNRLVQAMRSSQNRRPIPLTKGPLMPTGASLHIGLNAVDPKNYSGWDGQLTACEFDANGGNASHGYWKIRNRAINVCPFTPVTAPRFQITTVTKSLITLTRHLCRSISTGTTGPLTRLTIISTIYTRSSHTKLH